MERGAWSADAQAAERRANGENRNDGGKTTDGSAPGSKKVWPESGTRIEDAVGGRGAGSGAEDDPFDKQSVASGVTRIGEPIKGRATTSRRRPTSRIRGPWHGRQGENVAPEGAARRRCSQSSPQTRIGRGTTEWRVVGVAARRNAMQRNVHPSTRPRPSVNRRAFRRHSVASRMLVPLRTCVGCPYVASARRPAPFHFRSHSAVLALSIQPPLLALLVFTLLRVRRPHRHVRMSGRSRPDVSIVRCAPSPLTNTDECREIAKFTRSTIDATVERVRVARL